MADLVNLFAAKRFDFAGFYNNIKEPSWPSCGSIDQFESLPDSIKAECIEVHDLVGHILKCDNTHLDGNRIVVPHLEWHAAHSCNLTCESCSHLSNHHVGGLVELEQLKEWFGLWTDKIVPLKLAVLGGEPLLNKRIVDIVKLSREMWATTPGQIFELVTNGFLLDNYPDLPQALADTDCKLTISYHGKTENYNKKFQSVLETAKQWQQQWGIQVRTEIPNLESEGIWQRVFNGYGNHMMPYQHNDPKSSWNNCPTGQNCFQLVNGKIYKCAPLAYLPLQLTKYKLHQSWDHYLSYQPLLSGASQDDIRRFFNRGAESHCAMCPSKPVKFAKRDPTMPIAFYEKNIELSAMPTIG